MASGSKVWSDILSDGGKTMEVHSLLGFDCPKS